MLYGISECLISKLQRVQNAAARLIARKKKFDHITPVLMNLHWLPIRQRIKYKLLLLAHRTLHGRAPSYLADLLTRHTPSRVLRSADANLLIEPFSRLATYGDRAFSNAVPRLWNALPFEMRAMSSDYTFKTHLKTLLFREAYGSTP